MSHQRRSSSCRTGSRSSRRATDRRPHRHDANASFLPGGDYNLVENNQIFGGLYGLRFEGDYNVYRGNMIRDYGTAPVLDSGVGNTNAGGNVF